MSKFPRRPASLYILVGLVCAVVALSAVAVMPQLIHASAVPPDPIAEAWARARASGSYHFDGDLTQVTLPSAILGNVGRSSQTDQFHLEGKSDLRNAGLEMKLWAGAGSVAQDETSVGVKVEGGKTFVRQTTGEWKEDSSLSTDSIAPQGDFMAFLQAVRDVRPSGTETRAGITFTRYTFQVDGPAFAEWAREQMEAAMLRKGELAPGSHLSTPSYYNDMTGSGELWIREDGAQAGLPLRQVLTLQFPEQRNESVHAQIVVTFSEFGQPAPAGLAGTLTQFRDMLPDASLMLILVLTLLAIVALFRLRGTPRAQRVMAVVIITVLVSGSPLMGIRQTSLLNARIANAATTEKQRSEADSIRELHEADAKAVFNPHQSPEQAAQARGEAEARMAALMASSNFGSAVSAPANAPAAQATTDSGTDTDGDTLTDFAEVRIGTSEVVSDTDDDGVPDNVEVKGVVMGGKTWYLDPNEIDSNDDGVSDFQECWSTPPAITIPLAQWPACSLNTDGDGIPDAFDLDNDNDGVPDRIDLSSFTASTASYTDASPLQLTLSNLTPNKPVFVDVQIRPSDEKHLWMAFNVLDWPNDNQGQVTDIDGKTWADVAGPGQLSTVNDRLGDMKLIPMLEMRITGAVTNLPPQSELTPYNISVNNFTADGNTKVVYLPLNVITDEKTGARSAFSARMRYLPGGSWPTPHEVRLVWAVQALVDVPCDFKAANAAQQGCTSDGYIHNQPQVIQSYPDTWRITGLNVSENHGAKTAVIYEDPAVDTNLKDDAAVTALSTGLDDAMLGARDADNNGQRDITVDEIARRFDHTSNSAVSADARWGIDGDLNILRVEPHSYSTFDQAAIFTAMTETVTTLNTHFNTSWTADNTIRPTLMFVYEQQSRALGLDSALASGNYVTQTSNSLTVNMQPSGQPAVTVNTQVGMKWAHYCRNAGASAWSQCDAESNWNTLDSRYASNIVVPGDPVDPDVQAGRLFMAQAYDAAMIQGINSLVQQNTTIISGRYGLKSDTALATQVRSGTQAGTTIVVALSNVVLMAQFNNVSITKQLGVQARRFRAGKIGQALIPKGFGSNFRATTRLIKNVGVAIALLGATIYFAQQGNLGAKITLKVVAITLQLVIGVIDPIMTLNTWRNATRAAGAGAEAVKLTTNSEVIGTSKFAGAIGAAITVAVTWGFFIYSMVSNRVSAFSPEFNKAFAETIAATIYIIVLAVLSSTGVGAILVTIVAVIDAILTAVCELGVDELRNAPGLGGACFTLGTAAIKGIAYFLYNYDLMIDTGRSDLIDTGAPKTQLADPGKGFVTGNELSISLPITTHAVHKSPDIANGIYINFYLWLFSRDNLRSSTFKYTLTQPAKQDLSVSRDEMSGAWQNVGEDHKYALTPMYGGYAPTTAGPVNNFNLQPGLNRSAPFYLNMGYAVPAYECWAVPMIFVGWIPICYTRTFKGNSSSPVDTLRYDIFPATLDGFVALTTKSDGGQGLAWDSAFPSLSDADNDGLISVDHGGLDPSDTSWDADNDGLGDAYELDRRASGVAYSTGQCDVDSDGLTDLQETLLGSNPAVADTDNDGLKDGEEVWHQVYTSCAATTNWAGGWDITINAATPFTLHVSSDVGVGDTDGDGVSDLAEKQLANQVDPAKRLDNRNVPYNPVVVNTPPIAVYTEADRRFVAPGTSVIYTTTLVANVAVAAGVLDVSAPAVLGGDQAPVAVPFDPLTFSGAQTVTSQVSLFLQPGTSSQQLALTSTVPSRLAATGTPTWSWDAYSTQPVVNNFTSIPPRYVAIVPSLGNRQDSFRMAALHTNSATRGGDSGGVQTTMLPGGQARTLAPPPPTGGSTTPISWGDWAPDVACNLAGTCMAVWDFDETFVGGGVLTRYGKARGAILRPDGTVAVEVTLTSLASALSPAVASDGTNFVVAVETNNDVAKTTDITFLKYDAAGTLLNTTSMNIETNRTRSFEERGVDFDLIWIGDQYRLAWKLTRSNTVLESIWVRNVDVNGVPTGSSGFVGQAVGDANGVPAMAYDPARNRIALLFKWIDNRLHRVLFNGSDVNSYAVTEAVFPQGISSATAPQIAYNPMADGWLVSFSTLYVLFKPDLSGYVLNDFISQSSQPYALACPMPEAFQAGKPVANLRFEDAPGTTTFADSTGRGYTATCTGGSCPIAGAAGAVDAGGAAVGTPSSDYALRFTTGGGASTLSMNNPAPSGYTVAFWYKSDGGGGDFYLGTNSTSGYTFLIPAGQVNALYYLGSSSFDTGVKLNDNRWHQVVFTRDASNGNIAVYVDAILRVGPYSLSGFNAAPTLTIGGNYGSNASIDELQFYSSALDANAVTALYNRTSQSYCANVVYSNSLNQLQWGKLNVQLSDTRGGKITASGGLTLTVDTDKPTSSLVGLSNNDYIQGNTTWGIGGTADDTTSSVARVEININGAGFQPTNGAAAWSSDLTVGEGSYTLQTRATDIAGNVETPSAGITVIADGTAPNVALTGIASTSIKPTRNISGVWSVAISGTASDPAIGANAGSGVQAGSVKVLLQGQDGETIGNGWQAATLNGSAWTINYVFATGLLDPTGTYSVSVRAADAVGNQTTDTAATATLRLDTAGPVATVSDADAARTIVTGTITLSGLITETGSAGLSALDVAFTPVEQIAAIPGDATSDQAEALLSRTWYSATLAQRGGGVTQTTWSVQVPAGLENMIQLDLRGTDALGNRQITSGAWRGVVDTLAPRVSIKATGNGATYNDQSGRSRRYAVQFTCAAVDQYLSDHSFKCPGNAIRPPTRVFSNSAALQALFPDLSIRSALVNTYTLWLTSTQPLATASACDTYGHCTLASTQTVADAALGGELMAALDSDFQALPVSQAALSLPMAVVIAPTDQSYVAASTGSISVTIAAESAQPLREIVVTLDGNVVATLPFSQSAAITQTQRTISISPNGQGLHMVSARSTDWAGTAQAAEFPVSFSLDTQPPSVTLDTDPLTISDTWQLGSGVLRFRGTATDTAGLATVQVKVGNLPFADAMFADGLWSIALPVADPEGKTLSVTVQALDYAGQIAQVTASIGTNLSSPDAPDTSVLSGPTNPSSVNTATFNITGTSAARDVVGFECQLDESAFMPCASQYVLTDISNGAHVLRVRAIDSRGFVDLSSASFNWTVNVAALKTTITAAPANPSTRRDDGFTFSGSAGVVGFECALDGGDVAPCNNGSAFYFGLADGDHVFAVRAKDSAGNVGATTQYVWTVVNAAPIANAQAVITISEVPITITLIAVDSDALSYKVSTPAHGVLQGVPPNLIYTSDTGYSGSDTFTFSANDGQANSNLATVTITVIPKDVSPPTTTIAVLPQAATGANGWYTNSVSVVVSATDGIDPKASGVAQTRCGLDLVPPPATFVALQVGCVYTGTGALVGSDGTHTITAASRDNVGNVEVPISRTFKIDKTAPVITLTGVTSGATYLLGAVPTAACLTADVTAGVAASSTLSVTGGNVQNVGRYTATCSTATDRAGNRAGPVSAIYTVTYDAKTFVVLSQEGVLLTQYSTVVSGSVGANRASAGPFLAGNVEVSVGQGVLMQAPASNVLGNRIALTQLAKVYNISYNQLTGTGTIQGTKVTPVALPLVANFPTMPATTPGTQNVTTPQYGKATLAAGNYGSFTPNQFSVITLTGGLYQFQAWDVGQYVKIHVLAPTVIRIAGRVNVSQFATVGPVPTAPTLRAKDIVIYVGGQNGTTGALTATPVAALFGQYSVINANVIAPNGTLQLVQGTTATGAFVGKWVSVGQQVTLKLDSGLP